MHKVRWKGGIDSPELFKHDSMEFALSKNLYDNGILKELQLKSEENGQGVLYFFFFLRNQCAELCYAEFTVFFSLNEILGVFHNFLVTFGN